MNENPVNSIIFLFEIILFFLASSAEVLFFLRKAIFLDLEREIYELSSLLSDQRMLIETLMQMTGEDRSSLGTASLHTSFSVNPMNVLMQKMDGIAVGLHLYAVIVGSKQLKALNKKTVFLSF